MPISKLIYTLSQTNEKLIESISRIEDMDQKLKTVITVGTLFILAAEFSSKIEMLVDQCAGLIKHQLRTSQSLKIIKELPRNIPYIFIEFLIRKNKHQLLRNIVDRFNIEIGEQVLNSNTSIDPSSQELSELQFAIAYIVLQYEKNSKTCGSYELVYENCLSEIPSFGMSDEHKRSTDG